jgi:hypothetical protein
MVTGAVGLIIRDLFLARAFSKPAGEEAHRIHWDAA